MRCKEVQDSLSAHLDGELWGREKEGLEEHLRGCRRCSQELAQIQELDRLLKKDPALESPPDFEMRFWRRLAAESERGNWLSGLLWSAFPYRWAAVSSLAGLILVLGLGLYLTSPKAGRPVAQTVAGPPPKELAERLDLFLDYPILKEMDKLDDFETIRRLPVKKNGRGDI